MGIVVSSTKKETLSRPEAIEEIEGELRDFSAFLSTLNDVNARGSLAPWEETLLRSYLVYKLKSRVEG